MNVTSIFTKDQGDSYPFGLLHLQRFDERKVNAHQNDMNIDSNANATETRDEAAGGDSPGHRMAQARLACVQCFRSPMLPIATLGSVLALCIRSWHAAKRGEKRSVCRFNFCRWLRATARLAARRRCGACVRWRQRLLSTGTLWVQCFSRRG